MGASSFSLMTSTDVKPSTLFVSLALKLHLLNPHCVFVLGCADGRVRSALQQQLVKTDEEARDYLEKIVQIPVRLPRPRDDDLDRLLRRLGWDRFADDEEMFGLVQAFAGRHANPRRLKRFLHWYELQRAALEYVPGLSDTDASLLLDDERYLLKAMMLQYLDPEGFIEVRDYAVRDVGDREHRGASSRTEVSDE